MARTVHALLVGIDDYPPGVNKLAGCVNDIEAVERLLATRVSAAGDTLDVRKLLDADATRAGVIQGFEEHLARAGADDVALFYYSGHGSQEQTPEQWRHLEPDGVNETLVLHDSRVDGGTDLADKELAALLAGVAEGAPHLLVVLDCCHSGSGTRAALDDGVAERRAAADTRPRSVDTYHLGDRAVEDLVRSGELSPMGDSGWNVPRAGHVLLSGCRSNETSKEHTVDGVRRGAMSLALERVLTSSGTGLTYRDIHRQVASQVGQLVPAQHPQLETSSTGDLDTAFLGGSVLALPQTYVLTHGLAGWTIDGGSVHGVLPPVGDEATLLEVVEMTEAGPGTVAAQARVTAVNPGDATIEVTSGTLDPASSYRGVVTALPLPPVGVRIDGDTAAADELREALAARDGAGGPLLVVEVPADLAESAGIAVRAAREGYSVSRPTDVRELCPRADDPTATVQVLEHVAQWLRVAALTNGATRLRSDAVTITVAPTRPAAEDDDPWEVDGGYRITYPDPHTEPTYTITVTNNTDAPLWVGLLDLTDTFGIISALESGVGAEEVAGGATLTIPCESYVDDALWEQGVTEVTDLNKLVVSTAEFDPRTLAQPDLVVAAALRDVSGVRGGPDSTLDRLLGHLATRGTRPAGSARRTADWFTHDITVVTVRPQPGVAVPDPGADAATVAAGVRVVAHPLTATVSLTPVPEATRGLAATPVPTALEGSDCFGLTVTRGADDEVALLVTLPAGADRTIVTAEAPLRFQLDRDLGDDEQVLPYAWDGELYVPLGFGRAGHGGGSEVVIERLPEPISTTRSLGSSVRILFRKLVGRRLGLDFPYPMLRQATGIAGDDVVYEADTPSIAAAVAGASSVVVYVHGIIGDTRGMARSAWASGAAPPLAGRYDVVLTLDYENLHTTIEENARLFATRLRQVGLGPGHGKRLDVVAHSMGGLVSRHMIETVGGVEVSRLVTLGTPNGGSPWPTAQKWATYAVGLAVNSMTAVAWPLKVVGSALSVLERVDHALDQMEAGSDFLRELRQAPDPGVPYHVIVGNRALIESVDPRGLIRRLWPVASRAIDLAFLEMPNDIAVAVSSGLDLPGGRDPMWTQETVASDHMSYFATEDSLDALAAALDGPGPGVDPQGRTGACPTP